MTGKEKIEPLLREADVYHDQGLLEQSEQKYRDILQIIHENEELSGDETLVQSLHGKIRAVQADMDEIAGIQDTPELPGEMQDLIRNLFSYSKSREMAAIEGAVALGKFGQVEKAVEEFQGLIDKGILPLIAAKNMLRCQVTFSSPDRAIEQFMTWSSKEIFNHRELQDLKTFLEGILEKEGIQADLSISAEPSDNDGEGADREKVLEISSIRTFLDSGPLKGQEVDLDVTFQAGNTVSFIVNGDEEKLIDSFSPGITLSKIQCYSNMSVFNARGTVRGKKRITSGPKCGDYSVDLTVEGP